MATQVRRQVNRNTYASGSYVYGNTVTKPDVRRQFEEPRKKTLSNQARKNREKAKYMSLGYIAFLLVAFSVAAVVLIGYIRLNADITTLNEEIARQEKVLNTMRLENAESLTRIESSIDIEEIKRVAIQELGMTYPKEGQIISYAGVTYDYVRKVDDSN